MTNSYYFTSSEKESKMQFNKWSKVVCPSEADNHFWVAPTPTQNTVYIVPTIFYFRHLSCVLFYKNKGATKETFFPSIFS